MIKTSQVRQFVDNDFNNVILSGYKLRNKLDLRLSVKGKKTDYIDCYSEKFDKIVKQPEKLCNYLLDSFLANNTIIGIEYFCSNQYHPDKTCIDVISTKGILTLAFKDFYFDDIFPNLVQRLELAKKEGVLKYIQEYKLKEKIRLKLNLTRKFSTGIFYNEYAVLNIVKNGKLVMYKKENEFLQRFMQEILRVSNCLEERHYESLVKQIEREIQLMYEEKSIYTKIDLGNIIFDSSNIKELKVLKQAVIAMKQEFNKSDENIKELDKQLTIGGMK